MIKEVMSTGQRKLLIDEIGIIQETSLSKRKELSGLKAYQLDRLVKKYIDGVAKQVMKNYAAGLKSHHILDFSLVDLRNDCGRIKIGGKPYWISELMAEIASLYQVVAKGNGAKKELTTVMLSHRLAWKKVIETELWDQKVAAAELAAQPSLDEGEDRDNLVLETPIHIANLKKCLQRSEQHGIYLKKIVEIYGDENAALARGGKKIRKQYYQCQSAILSSQQITRVKLLIELAKTYNKKWRYGDGYYLVPLSYKAHGKTPRLWAQGNINLQFAQREIRYAALSRGHQYDLSTASFSLMLAYAEAIGGVEIEAEYVKAYIENKSDFRRLAVAEIFGEHLAFKGSYAMRQVKQALTAIGFGAKTTGCFQEAMREAFNNNRKHADGFVNHEVIAGLAADWKKICDIIVNHHGKQLRPTALLSYTKDFATQMMAD